MVSHEDRKRERFKSIIKGIETAKEKGEKINKENLINDCIITWGMSRRTVLEYLKVIEARHGILG